MKIVARCAWAQTPLSVEYHDREWGVPVHDDRTLFEFLTLEGAQAGLSWETILRKRAGYRSAFANFDPAAVARFTRHASNGCSGIRTRQEPPQDQGTIRNARAFRKVQDEFGSFDACGGSSAATARECLEGDEHGAGPHRRVRCAEPRSVRPGIHVRRLDDLLRIHAGRRSRERP
jgi:3-methyladenine DNA glycosylase Tag